MDIIWKDVDGFDQRYEVSNTGIVRTKDRKLQLKFHEKGSGLYVQLFTKKALYKNSVRISNIVWNAFIGKLETGHTVIIKNIDGNIYNNDISNLKIEYYKNTEIQESFEGEIWKNIKDYESSYQISNFGRIRSLDRMIDYGASKQFYKSKIIKLTLNKTGYISCKLNKKGKSKTFSMHALVYDHFGTEKRDGQRRQIDHVDNNPSNNNINNLHLVDARDNIGKKHQFNGFTSKYPGVYKKRNKWAANIKINKKRMYIGVFDTENEASEAYIKTKKEYGL